MKTKAMVARARAASERSISRQGYVVGAATAGGRRDGRDVTGAGNDCPPHSYGNILSLEESG